MPDSRSPTRAEIFSAAAAKLRSDFSSLSIIPHSGAKGGEAETLFRDFLRARLPRRFDVTGGFIIDTKDQISKQTDVIVYDAFNCPLYRSSDDTSIIPHDNVAAIVELKSVLDKARLEDAFANIYTTKSLAKFRDPAHGRPITSSTFSCVFAFDSPLTLDKLAEHYLDNIRQSGTLGTHPDMIVVLDKGLITLAGSLEKPISFSTLLLDDFRPGPHLEGIHLAVGTQPLGRDTLDYFFRLLLLHLIHFRQLVPHPGLAWKQTLSQGFSALGYLTTLTAETDPARAAEKQEQYANDVLAYFAKHPFPKNYKPI